MPFVSILLCNSYLTMISFHSVLVWIIVSCVCFQVMCNSVPLKRIKRDGEEMEGEAQANPAVVTVQGGTHVSPFGDIFNIFLIPFKYFSEIFNNIVHAVIQIGHKITSGFTESFSSSNRPK